MASNEVPVHAQVLAAARRLLNEGKAQFRLSEIVKALPNLKEGTVRTHVSSRCCVNAPDNHQHRWPYFHRLRRGVYRLRTPFVKPETASEDPPSNRRPLPNRWRPPQKRPPVHPDTRR